ncbi:MAG: PDZ domain-containing protein [Clostridiales bacterium]|nr:PDZ domain-containing protein [Clostridiales bacterium]
MKKNRLFGIVALVLSLVMIFAAATVSAGADTVVSEDEISAIVNTQTDQTLVTSPFTQVASQVRNSVVGINNYQTITSYYGYGFGYGSRQQQSVEQLAGTGSGVVVTKYGHVLTNYHVVEDATRLTVTVAGEEKEYAAVVVGYDADQDIAVLQVSNLKLPPVPLGDSDALQVGEWAIVIGNPLGEEFARTVTVGVVSALDRELEDTNYDRFGRRYTTTNTMIQVDAAINSGNSGGGMFNVLGQLQGIPARKYSSNSFYSSTTVDNIGFCIPVNVAKPLIEEVLRSYDGSDPAGESQQAADNDSMLSKPRLGVSVYSLSSTVTEKLPMGSFVSEVEDKSPAQEGGIQVGDVIVAVDDVTCSSSNALITKLQEYKEGDVITVKVYRAEGMEDFYDHQDLSRVGDGEYIDLTITLRVIDNVTM